MHKRLSTIDLATRRAEMRVSLEQDIVHWCAPVLAAIKPGAMFAYPYTMKSRAEIRTRHPKVMLFDEFLCALTRCREQLEPAGVHVTVLAWRENGALLFFHRPELVKAALAEPLCAQNLQALGYDPTDFDGSLDELRARIHACDKLTRPRDFWDFPHEVGYFLGYPALDVQAYTRYRGQNCSTEGEWRAYGCHRRAHAMQQVFARLRACTESYWQLYLQGTSLADLAALGSLNL